MDQIVLEAVAAELAAALAGSRVQDVVQLEASRFLVRFADPPFPRLHVAIHPRLSTMHLVRGIKAPAAPTGLAVALTRELEGRALEAVVKPAAERLVRLRFSKGRTLVVELMGKASNLILLDEESRILAHARTHHGAFRQPVEGEPYVPPPAPPRPGLSLLLGREPDPERVLARLEAGEREPVLYSPAPPGELPESLPLSSRNLFAFVVPLAHASGLTATFHPTMNEAEAAATECMLRHMRFETIHQSLVSLLRQERRRAADLIGVLGKELAAAEDSSERDRRRGELILAGLHAARKEGSIVRVVDHYDPEAPVIEIPIDPKLDLKANAERLFRTARRAERAREILPGRIEKLSEALAGIDRAGERVASARTREELEAVERELQEAGVVHAFRKAGRAEVGRKAEYVRVREYRTSDGFTVLVGRSASENDHLTFKVAAPHDLWLHAAGHAGAHVVVRNPRRLAALPETAVLEAAAVAAWYSKGAEPGPGGAAGEIDVHVAFRRHVRKGRGMSPGMVMLKRHGTVRVRPALPAPRAAPGLRPRERED